MHPQKLIADHIHEITFNRWKTCEKHCESWIAPKDSSYKLEVTIDVGTQKRRVDIAIYHQSKIIQTIEVYNTHKTSLAARTGVDFLEVDATHAVHPLRNKDFNIKCTQTTQKQCTECCDIDNKPKLIRQLEDGIDDDIVNHAYVYFHVSFSNNNKIKKYGAKWDGDHKLWYIPKSGYYINRNEIDKIVHRIEWHCSACNNTGSRFWDAFYETCPYCCCLVCSFPGARKKIDECEC